MSNSSIKKDINSTGKYIKFKHHFRQVWVRGRPKTLGPSYTKEAISEQITNKVHIRTNKLVNNHGIETSEITVQDSIRLCRCAKMYAKKY